MMEKTQAKPLTAAQQRQRDKKRRTWLRTGVQLFFFVSMPGAFVAGFSGVKQIFLHIGAGEVLSVDSFTLSLLGLCGFTLLFDRFFCGYACAFGSLGDAVWALSGLIQKKLFHRKKQLRLPERAVLLGQKVKYLLLAWLVALYVTRQEKMLTGASPWEVFSRLTALHLPPEGFGVGIGLLVLILLGMAVQPRFFCQFLCPMGAVFALLPVLPFARLHRQSDGCIPGCNACKQQCPVCLKLEETSLRSGECIACEACVGTCPKQNIQFSGIPPMQASGGCRCWVKCCSSSCWAAGWAFADSSELKKEAAALRKRELAYGRQNRLILQEKRKQEVPAGELPCCTYRWSVVFFAGCVLFRGAPCFCFYGNSCCSICNERVISANAQCSGLIQNPPCKSCTDLAVLRPIGAFPPAQQCIL